VRARPASSAGCRGLQRAPRAPRRGALRSLPARLHACCGASRRGGELLPVPARRLPAAPAGAARARGRARAARQPGAAWERRARAAWGRRPWPARPGRARQPRAAGSDRALDGRTSGAPGRDGAHRRDGKLRRGRHRRATCPDLAKALC
jgi:hypothetical protein